VGFGSPGFWHRGDPPVFLFHILVGDEVQSSLIQANSPRAPARMNRVATLIMSNWQMWSCPGRETAEVSVLASRETVTLVSPDADWGTQNKGRGSIASVIIRAKGRQAIPSPSRSRDPVEPVSIT